MLSDWPRRTTHGIEPDTAIMATSYLQWQRGSRPPARNGSSRGDAYIERTNLTRRCTTPAATLGAVRDPYGRGVEAEAVLPQPRHYPVTDRKRSVMELPGTAVHLPPFLPPCPSESRGVGTRSDLVSGRRRSRHDWTRVSRPVGRVSPEGPGGSLGDTARCRAQSASHSAGYCRTKVSQRQANWGTWFSIAELVTGPGQSPSSTTPSENDRSRRSHPLQRP